MRKTIPISALENRPCFGPPLKPEVTRQVVRPARAAVPRWLICVLALFAICAQTVSAADFTVTSPGFFYTINNQQPNPTITLVRGRTYTFAINASSIHPFFIRSAGVQNNNVSQGTITFTVPNVASNYTYICSIHDFGGTIVTVAPPPPPPPVIRLLSLSVSSNMVLRSTGTNGWNVLPEYSTNLAQTNWFGLTVLTNTFLSGTNETICGRPPGDSFFLRVRSQPN
jgi:hypothetical protein